MAEYIEREAVCYQLAKQATIDGQPRAIKRAAKIVAGFPAADVEPVKHGEWISLTECANAGVYCSVCHKKVYKEDYAWCNKKNKVRSNYCPNCGAHMKDGE